MRRLRYPTTPKLSERRPRGTDFLSSTVGPSEVSRRGLSRSLMRLEFFAGPMEETRPLLSQAHLRHHEDF